MCGRYSVVIDEAKLRKQFTKELTTPPDGIGKNYNMAPTQRGPVITDARPEEISDFRWGLVPFWAKDIKIGARMINARREGIEEKSSFRKPIRERRCLVIADSFYEWRRTQDGKKIPYRILPADDGLLVMAGIWEKWTPKDGDDTEPVYTYSVITGEPNKEMRQLHDRMPMLLLDEDRRQRWLQPDLPLPEVLELLATPPDGTLRAYPTNPAVGNVRNNGPELHEAA